MQTYWHKLCIVREVFGKKDLHGKSCEDKRECDLYGKKVKEKRDADLRKGCKS